MSWFGRSEPDYPHGNNGQSGWSSSTLHGSSTTADGSNDADTSGSGPSR
jgi:hypothetical protein